MKITEAQASKVLEIVDAGLVRGLGEPIPGQMCVMAAISYALGLPHGDDPDQCVDEVVRAGDISLNDAGWSSPQARAKGMRREAIAKLGSAGTIDSVKYAQLLVERTIREIVPIALRAAAKLNPDQAQQLQEAALRCEKEGNWAAAEAARATARAARTAAWAAAEATEAAWAAARAAARAAGTATARAAAEAAADAAAVAGAAAQAAWGAAAAVAQAASISSDTVLSHMADIMVRCLQDVGSPGCQWLYLAEKQL